MRARGSRRTERGPSSALTTGAQLSGSQEPRVPPGHFHCGARSTLRSKLGLSPAPQDPSAWLTCPS